MPHRDLSGPPRDLDRIPARLRGLWLPYLAVPASRRNRRGKGGDLAGEPVEPHRPRPLSGGAAAPLEFDD